MNNACSRILWISRLAYLLGLVMSCSSCGHVEFTKCGMAVETSEWLTIEDVQAAENATISMITADPRLQSKELNCRSLNGVHLAGYNVQNWMHEDPENRGHWVAISGIANCDLKTVRVARPHKDRWQSGSIPHELVHIMQNCNSHYRWEEMGIKDGLHEIMRDGLW